MEFAWTAPDGTKFPCEEWMPDNPPAGLLICVHGMGGAAMQFRPLGEAAAAKGFAAAALNLRGQGMDPLLSRRGGFLVPSRLADEVCAFIKDQRRAVPAGPLFLCGESMGALLVAWMLARLPIASQVTGAIFSVPVVQLRKPTPPPVLAVVRTLAMIMPWFRLKPSLFVSGKSEPLRVTRDEEYGAFLRTAPHSIPAFTFHSLDQMGRLMDTSVAMAPQIRTPSLVLAAGQDVYVAPEQVEAWFQSLGAADKTFRLYPDSFHLLWNDWDQSLVLSDIFEWMEARTGVQTCRVNDGCL